MHNQNENYIPVVDNPNLMRDRTTGAIIDVDRAAYEKYLASKQERIQQRAKISQLEERLNNMESNITDIKDLLTRLLER